jgi:branched-chain amino acid aminotransferase
MPQPNNAANANVIVNINGQLVPRDQAGVSPFDSSVQNGDAVWEGLRLYNGRIFRLRQHLDRLKKSAAMLQYDKFPDDAYLLEQLTRTLRANHMTDGVHIRLTVSRGVKYTSGLDPRLNTAGCSLFILPEHKPPVYDKAGITLITSKFRRPLANVLDQHIHSCNQLMSILAKLEANAAGADDALMLDTDGFVAETNATHVFIVKGGVVHTPTTRACPVGITRGAVLELCEQYRFPGIARDLRLADIEAADEVFCTGTMGELVPVTRIDGHTFRAGETFAALAAVFRVMTADPREGWEIGARTLQ